MEQLSLIPEAGLQKCLFYFRYSRVLLSCVLPMLPSSSLSVLFNSLMSVSYTSCELASCINLANERNPSRERTYNQFFIIYFRMNEPAKFSLSGRCSRSDLWQQVSGSLCVLVCDSIFVL